MNFFASDFKANFACIFAFFTVLHCNFWGLHLHCRCFWWCSHFSQVFYSHFCLFPRKSLHFSVSPHFFRRFIIYSRDWKPNHPEWCLSQMLAVARLVACRLIGGMPRHWLGTGRSPLPQPSPPAVLPLIFGVPPAARHFWSSLFIFMCFMQCVFVSFFRAFWCLEAKEVLVFFCLI